MDESKLNFCLTSTAIIVGCAGIAYFILKNRRQLREAVDALNYLKINIVVDDVVCDDVVFELRKRCKYHHAVGFDCEWVTENGKRRPVALLQLSTFDGYCALFRLNKMKSVPNSLKELLEDNSVYKVGVAPDGDGKYLLQDYSVQMESSLDIRHIANLCGRNAGGLASLTKALLGVILDKTWRVRCSDWEADDLTDRQVTYAAADAHVAVRIFAKLVDELSTTAVWWLFCRRNKAVWRNIDTLCCQFADVHYKTKKRPSDQTGTKEKSPMDKELPLSKRYPHATRSKPLYHNCFLQAPDGELLCTCDVKKALWYVEKELADMITEDPLTVRLRFEPAGRSVGAVGRYYQLKKENKCVVCGATNSYIRKNVVPREYRKYFPEVMKEHSSHDVVLLCVRCHQRSNAADESVRDALALACRAPRPTGDCAEFTEDVACKKIRSAARALLYQSQKHVLPESRRQELESVILQHYPDYAEVTEDLLREAADIAVLSKNSEYECHGQKVVEHFAKHGDGLLKLEEIWRAHFLDVMQPRYMPELWSIKHNEERLLVKLKEGRLSEEEIKLIGVSRWL